MGRKSGKNGLVTEKIRGKRIQCEYKSKTTAAVTARIAAAAREFTAMPYRTWPYRILRQLIWRYPAAVKMPLNNTDCPRPFIHLYLQAQGKQAHLFLIYA